MDRTIKIWWIAISLLFVAVQAPSYAFSQDKAGEKAEKAAEPEKQWDAFPVLSRKVGVTEKFDGPLYDDLRDCIRDFRSQVGGKYYASVVDLTDPSGSKSRKKNDATEYATGLWEAWRDNHKLSPETHVIIVSGVRNRSLGIHVGENWTALGFSGETIAKTVKSSDFNFHMKKRNRIQAICSLATAIDFELKSLQKKRNKEIADAKTARDRATATFVGFEGEIDKAFDDSHGFANTIRSKLTTAKTEFDGVAATLEQKPLDVIAAAETLESVIDTQNARRARYKDDIKILDQFKGDIDAMRADLDQRFSLFAYPGGSSAASEKLDECVALEQAVRTTFEQSPYDVKDCLRDIEVGLAEAEARAYYQTEILPAHYIVFAMILALLFVIFALLRRKKLSQALTADLVAWREHLNKTQTGLDELSVNHALYLKQRKPWQGEAQILDQKTISLLNLVFKLHAELEQILANAEALQKKSLLLNTSKLDKALALLRESDVSIDPKPLDPRVPIDVGQATPYSATANLAWGDLLRMFGEAKVMLTDVETVMTEMVDLMTRASEAHGRVSQAIDDRSHFGFSVDDLRETLEVLTEAYANARGVAGVDPVRGIDLFSVLTEELESLCQRVESGNRVISQIRSGLIERLANLRGYYVRLKNSGVNLEEPEFHPEKMLDGLSENAQKLVEQVRTGDEIGAAKKLEELQTAMRRLARWLRACETAPQILPGMLTEIAHQCECAKNDILKIRVVFVKQDAETQEKYKNEIGELSDFLSIVSKTLIIVDKSRRAFTEKRLFESVRMIQAVIDPINEGVEKTRQMALITGVEMTFEGTVWPVEWDEAAVESVIT